MPIRVYLLVIFLFFSLVTLLYSYGRIVVPFSVKVWLLMASIVIFIQLNDLDNGGFWYYFFRGPIVSLLIFYLTYYALDNSQYSIDKFASIMVVIVAFSAFVAFMQAIGVGFFWKLRQIFPAPEGAVMLSILNMDRPVGISFNSTELGYQISTVFPFAWYLSRKTNYQNKKLFFNAMLLILFLGAISSETRSSVLGVIVSILIIRYSLGKRLNIISKWMPIILMILFAAMIVFVFGLSGRLFVLDSSSQGKIFLVWSGVMYMIHNPFGSGLLMTDFIQFKSTILGNFNQFGDQIVAQVKEYTPHNQFVNTGVMYGWTGLLVLIYFYKKLWSMLSAGRKFGRIAPYLSVAMQASMAGYIVNSMFHNGGPFVLDPFSWYFIGIVSAVVASDIRCNAKMIC